MTVKRMFHYSAFALLTTLLMLFSGCRKKQAPTLTTSEVTAITPTTAKSGGNITSDGRSGVSVRGVCWSANPNPAIENDTRTIDGSGAGSFTSSIYGLTPNTTYYLRSYAINGEGTGYGDVITFTTADDVPPLSVMTKEATDISPTAAKTGGNIAGRSTGITERGVCWATSNDPTINNNKAADATGAGAESFTINISGLTPSTTYYVRAYAIKNSETIYGEVISFTTRNAVPVITTAAVDYATVRSARSGGNITYSGVLPIIMRGVCWSRTPNPTINNKKTADGAGAGSFTSDINPLVSDSLYYARAYATTGEGTYYGNEISFKTTSYAVDQDGEYYETVLIGEQVWFAENLRTAKYNEGTGIPHITTGWDVANGDGFCWYNNYPANKYAYGALYKGHAVVTGKLCPTGWHVPSNADWQQLKDFLGYPEGTKLKATSGWNTPVDGDGNGTNESGFNGLAGGFRYESGTFGGLGEFGRWWSSTEFTGNSAHLLSMSLNYERLDMTTHHNDKRQGLSVRCVKD